MCVYIYTHTYTVSLYSNKAGSLQKAFNFSRKENHGLFRLGFKLCCSAAEFFMQYLTAVKLLRKYSSVRIAQFKIVWVLLVF